MMRTRLTACLMATAFAVTGGTAAHARCEDHVPQARPQNTARDIVGADLDTITERGFIEFAAYRDFPPWSFEQDGKPAGVDIEIGKLIADDLGVDARFNLVSAGENLDEDLRNWVWKGPIVSGRVANVMLHVPYDSNYACRVEQVVFTGQYHVEGIAIAYRKDIYPDDAPVPAYFRYDQVAVENDTIADFYLTNLLGPQAGPNIHRFPTMGDAMATLSDGQIGAAMGPRSQLEYGLTGDSVVHEPPMPGFGVGKWTLGVGVHFAYRPLAYSVDDAIQAAISDGRMARIFADYGLTFSPPELR